MKKVLRHFPALTILAVILIWPGGCSGEQDDNRIHIALAVPLSGDSAHSGSLIRDGVNLYLDEINEKGGIHGRKVVLDLYDDGNDPSKAEAAAREIALQSRAVAVIGHYYSSCSIAAGRVYRENGVPAISPASTNIKVAKDNSWYFRTIFNDRLQGRLLASYAANILEQKAAGIVYENDEYGSYLADVFEEAARELGMEIKYKWRIGGNASMTPEEIADELKNREDGEIVFLATHAPIGAGLIKIIRDNGVKIPLIGPDSIASKNFTDAFKKYPKEKKNPGYYSDGIYVSSAMVFDTANEMAQGFRKKFRKKYGRDPSIFAAVAYDTATILANAIRDNKVIGRKKTLAKARRLIRDHLANMTDIESAVEGVTGYNYFDGDGNSARPIRLGVYKDNHIVSASTQLQIVGNVNAIPDLEKALEEKTVLLVDGRHMYKTNVVFTGIEFNKIGEIDPTGMTCNLDFNLWFRYRGAVDVRNITFLNATETVELGDPIEEISQNRMNYRLYRVRGKFKLDFLPAPYVYGRHIASVSFRHNAVARSNLLFVSDMIGMGVDPLGRMKKRQVLSGQGWKIGDIRFFQNFEAKSIQGSPEYINFLGGTLEYSVFNASVRIERYTISPRGLGSGSLMRPLAIIAVLMLIAGLTVGKNRRFKKRRKSVWTFLSVSVILLLLSGEIICFEWLTGVIDRYYMGYVKLSFDILWWIVPAFLIDIAFRPFVWRPLEERTGRSIPNIVRRFVSFIVYLLTLFGIIAFVFSQRLTGLLATSGVVAMIIGLAVQINISNIFSGIAINIEHPFRIGDWVNIADYGEGKVIDITWRTTRIRTRDGSVLGIPNSVASESVFQNYTYPSDVYEEWIFIYVDPVHPNESVEKILLDAAQSTDNRVLKDPAPFTRLTGVEEWAARYLVGYCIREFAKRNTIRNHVWTRILHHLRYAGITPAIKDRERHMFREISSISEKALNPLEIVNEIDIFQPLPEDAKIFLAGKMRKLDFRAGKPIIKQGAEGNSLFIVLEGVVAVSVSSDDETPLEVARLGAGQFFGEMSLMTGEPRAATITSVTDTSLFEIRKDSVGRLIESRPEISEHLAKILADRKLATESALKNADLREESDSTYKKLLGNINRFFGSKNK